MEPYLTKEPPVIATIKNKKTLNKPGLNKPLSADAKGSLHAVYELGPKERYLVLHSAGSWTIIDGKKYSKVMLIGKKTNEHQTEHEIEDVSNHAEVLYRISKVFGIAQERFMGGISVSEWDKIRKDREKFGLEI